MNTRLYVVVSVLLVVGASAASAQLDIASLIQQVNVRLTFDGGCDFTARVDLVGTNGPPREEVTNNSCVVRFTNVRAGTYRVRVSSQSFAEVETNVDLDSWSKNIEIKVNRGSRPENTQGTTAGAVVSATDLNVPPKAAKDFEKANDFIAKNELQKAIEQLRKAVTIYPLYAAAYNNLGVVYDRLGDRSHERDSLEKCVSINDHFAPGYANLGRMYTLDGDFQKAEAALSKASSTDPTNSKTLVLLTYAQFMNHHFDEALATGQQAHALQNPHAFVHQVMARVFEQKRDAASAIAELERFLEEETSGPRADMARKELAELRAITR